MAKPTPELWLKAKALFEAGKSFREIDDLTSINYKSVERRAKAEGWNKGILSQHIVEKTRIEAEFVTLEPSQREVVTNEVSERLKHIAFFTKASMKVAQIAIKSLDEDATPIDCKSVMETLKTGMVVSGVVPFYPNATQINQTTNTQVNNDKIDKIEWTNPS